MKKIIHYSLSILFLIFSNDTFSSRNDIIDEGGLVASVIISQTSGTNPMCAGTSATFTAVPTNGGSAPGYQWKVNGSDVGTGGSTYTTTTLTTGQIVTCVMTSSLSGVSGSPATSNSITMIVNSIPSTPIPKINGSITPSAICAGGTITLTTSSVSGATYSWTGPGSYSASVRNPSALTSVTTAMGGTYSLTVTVSGCTSAQGTVTIVVNPIPATPLASSNSPVCVGSPINLSTPAVTGATYTWTGPASFLSSLQNPTRSSATLSMSGTYSLKTTVAGCNSTPGTTVVSVNSSLTPSIAVAASPSGSICAGTTVTFTATPTNGGTTPSYQWQVNGSNVGTDNPVYTSSTLISGQTVTCILTSNSPCASPLTATSSGITMTVNPIIIPTISISIGVGSNPMCAGQATTFIAVNSGGGSTPTYQWQINGANAGASLATLTSSTLNNADVITCTLTSSAPCASPSTVVSSSITMMVNPVVTPAIGISIDSGTNPTCAGQSVTFTANDTSGGTGASHQWQINNLDVGSDMPTFSSSTLNDNDTITCILTSDAACATTTIANSNEVTIIVIPVVIPAISIAIDSGANPMCSGELITFIAADTNAGTTPAYQWLINGSDAGFDQATFHPTSLNNGDIISCTLTSDAMCASPSTVSGPGITMTINPTPDMPTVTQVDTVLISSSTIGNQWFLDGILIPGATDQNYSFTENGTYTVVVTQGPCSSPVSAPTIITNVGIQETENLYSFAVYPNPNDGNFTLSFNFPVKTNYQLRLTNMLGQLVYTDTVTDFTGTYTKQLNINDYGKGIFIISLMNDRNKIVKKITVY